MAAKMTCMNYSTKILSRILKGKFFLQKGHVCTLTLCAAMIVRCLTFYSSMLGKVNLVQMKDVNLNIEIGLFLEQNFIFTKTI